MSLGCTATIGTALSGHELHMLSLSLHPVRIEGPVANRGAADCDWRGQQSSAGRPHVRNVFFTCSLGSAGPATFQSNQVVASSGNNLLSLTLPVSTASRVSSPLLCSATQPWWASMCLSTSMSLACCNKAGAGCWTWQRRFVATCRSATLLCAKAQCASVHPPWFNSERHNFVWLRSGASLSSSSVCAKWQSAMRLHMPFWKNLHNCVFLHIACNFLSVADAAAGSRLTDTSCGDMPVLHMP